MANAPPETPAAAIAAAAEEAFGASPWELHARTALIMEGKLNVDPSAKANAQSWIERLQDAESERRMEALLPDAKAGAGERNAGNRLAALIQARPPTTSLIPSSTYLVVCRITS